MDYVERLREQWGERLPGVDTEATEVVARILRIASLVGRAHEDALARHDLTPGEFELLAALRREGRPLRVGEITTVTESPAASITKRLDRLHRSGHVERTTPERDRRGVLVSLTAAGEELVDELFPAQVGRERAALVDLGHDDQVQLAALLAGVLAALEPPRY